MFDSTALYDQSTFYKTFERDLLSAQQEVIIESPFITEKRMNVLLPIFIKMRRRNIRIIVNTRNPDEHDGDYYYQALNAVSAMQDLGIIVLYTSGHHRKLAIIDRKIVYEGSLNILSFSDSCEIMRKIASETIAMQLCKFIAIDRYIRR
jgi:phosphatidylserine/phosphatidylglycerophosphate/cardiolipin synthase-like enzyme